MKASCWIAMAALLIAAPTVAQEVFVDYDRTATDAAEPG